MARILYPSVTNVPVKPAAVVVAPQGWDCVAPPATPQRARQQPPGDVLPPGRFTTTNTTQGGTCLAPATTRLVRPQQPPGEVLPPGRFTTTNTQFGGEAVAPDRTPQWVRQQPPGEVLPPGAFTTTNTRFGGEALFPPATRRLVPQYPPALTETPGAFSTTNTTRGGECVAPATTRRLTPQQPPGEVLPPGVFAGVTPSVVKGWDAFFPPAARRLVPQQPPGEVLPPGAFATTNTQQGWDVSAPPAARAWAFRQQPAADPLPLTPAAAAGRGGECLFPGATARRGAWQPQGETLPPGQFGATNTAFGWDVFAPVGHPRPWPQQPPAWQPAGVSAPAPAVPGTLAAVATYHLDGDLADDSGSGRDLTAAPSVTFGTGGGAAGSGWLASGTAAWAGEVAFTDLYLRFSVRFTFGGSSIPPVVQTLASAAGDVLSAACDRGVPGVTVTPLGQPAVSTGALSFGDWHAVEVLCSGGVLYLSVDGVLAATGVAPAAGTLTGWSFGAVTRIALDEVTVRAAGLAAGDPARAALRYGPAGVGRVSFRYGPAGVGRVARGGGP